MTLFDEFDQYSEDMLMAQYGISEIIQHEASKGEVRETFLLSTLASSSSPKPILCKGAIAEDKRQSGQLDIVLCRPYSRPYELGGYRLIPKADALCVFEVKGNCTGSDLRDANGAAQRISALDGNTAPLYGVICYSIRLKERTIYERFGLEYDAANRIYFDPAQDPNVKDPSKWPPIHYPHLDFFVSLEEDKKIFLRKYERTPGAGDFRFVRATETPVMKHVFLLLNSLWREANQPQTRK